MYVVNGNGNVLCLVTRYKFDGRNNNAYKHKWHIITNSRTETNVYVIFQTRNF